MSSKNSISINPNSGYKGIDNLEIMREAVNYNCFLLNTVLEYASLGKHIIDFGAGIGIFALRLKQLGHKITCIENDIFLKNQLIELDLDCVDSLSVIEDNSIDYIYTLNVLEHIEKDFETLVALHKKIRPNGVILVYVPAFNIIYSSMDRKVGHFRRYRLGDLRKLLEKAGFIIIHGEYVDFLGFFASLLYLFINQKEGNINLRVLRFYDRFVFPISRCFDHFSHSFIGKNLLIVARK